MNGPALNAEDWNQLTLTTRGGEIERALRPFRGHVLDLRPRLSDLETRLAPTLDLLGVTGCRVSVISADEALAPLARMSQRRADVYLQALLSLVTAPLRMPVNRMLHAAYGDVLFSACPNPNATGDLMDGVIRVMPKVSEESREGRLARSLYVPTGLIATLFYLTVATAFGFSDRDGVERLSQLFLDGNFPVGLQHDGAFVVLVK